MKTQIKIFLLMLIGLIFASCAVNAQKVIQWTPPTAATVDTFENTGSVINTFTLVSAPEKFLVQAQIKKVSGTMAGTTILQYRVDPTFDWVTKSAVGDTLTHTGITTTKTKIWEIEKPGAPYWRTVSTGSGTMKATAKASSHNKTP